MSLSSLIFRRMCRKSDRKRDAGLTTPADVVRYDDIRYGKNRKYQKLDVYRPKSAGSAPLPVIVSIHGGGWVYGDKEIYQHYCMSLAQRGFAVVNFSYRLAPEHRFPAALEDTNTVFAWVLSHADEYGFDTGRIFAVGDSAGAQALAMYACMLCSDSYAERYDFAAPAGLTLRALGLNCGIYDLRGLDESRTGYTKELFGRRATAAELETLSPAAFVNEKFPPCFLLTAVDDFMKNEPAGFAKVLDSFGVAYESKIYGNDENRLGHVFHCNVKTEDAARANDEQCAFFRRYL